MKMIEKSGVKVGRIEGSESQAPCGSYWRWLDKSHLALFAADQVPEVRLLWHKIIFSGKLGAGGRSGGVMDNRSGRLANNRQVPSSQNCRRTGSEG